MASKKEIDQVLKKLSLVTEDELRTALEDFEFKPISLITEMVKDGNEDD